MEEKGFMVCSAVGLSKGTRVKEMGCTLKEKAHLELEGAEEEVPGGVS
jgi:hypothetical protein